LALFSQSPSFKLGTIFQSPSFKLGTLPKAQALNLALMTFISLTFKPKPFQAFKNFKISNTQTNNFLPKNYVTLILYP